MTPAQRNKELLEIKNEGSCCIITLTSGNYIHYEPMFFYMAKKACPDYDIFNLRTNRTGYETAALRFTMDMDAVAGKYDYYLITDIDIMMMKESMSIIDAHMLHLRREGLECYSNYTNNGDRCPGVHFVTKDWWNKTKAERDIESSKIDENISYDYDEKMLRRIIVKSGLPVPPEKPIQWAHHGEHLGTHRARIKDKSSYYGTHYIHGTAAMLEDNKFLKIAKYCDSQAPELNIWKCIERLKIR